MAQKQQQNKWNVFFFYGHSQRICLKRPVLVSKLVTIRIELNGKNVCRWWLCSCNNNTHIRRITPDFTQNIHVSKKYDIKLETTLEKKRGGGGQWKRLGLSKQTSNLYVLCQQTDSSGEHSAVRFSRTSSSSKAAPCICYKRQYVIWVLRGQ